MRRRLATGVATTVLTLAASLLATTPAQAVNRVTPGSFTGYGFDQCITPTQSEMDTWLTTSPYWAVGIYIAGDSRFCGDDKQVNLTPTWVATQLRNGWRLLPITLGPQASCSERPAYQDDVRIDPAPTDGYAAARTQGRVEARTTVRVARRLGIAARSTLWYDIENFDIRRTHCRESALAFLSAWTNQLHALDYVSGVYSSASSGIKMLDDARRQTPGKYAMPDRLWIAEWMKEPVAAPPLDPAPSLLSSYFADDGWMPRQRMRQYRGGHNETYGGVTINIDSNYLDLGRGSVAPREPAHCGGVSLSFERYQRLKRGDRDPQVRSLQCALREKRFYTGDLRKLYTRRTERAVRAFQAAHALPVDGVATARTWTTLLAKGAAPVVKIGSAKPAVRRAQRALNAATGARLHVTGVFDVTTTRAVRAYQERRGLPRTGVLAADSWAQLQAGRR